MAQDIPTATTDSLPAGGGQSTVLTGLRRMILDGELAPGASIGQTAAAQRLGVSRIPLREALKTLEAEGLVVHARHRGYAVAQLSLDELRENYRIRELLEAEAVTRAVERLTGPDVERLAALAQRVEEAVAAGDLQSLPALNREFHFALFELCGMPRLLTILRTLWDATDAYRAVYLAGAEHLHGVLHEHDSLVTAVRRRDAAAAVAALATHRRSAVEALAPLLAGGSSRAVS